MKNYVAMPPKDMTWAFRALNEHKRKGVILSKILKSGKPGKPSFYEFYGTDETAADVIKRLEQLNPGAHWVEAEQ